MGVRLSIGCGVELNDHVIRTFFALRKHTNTAVGEIIAPHIFWRTNTTHTRTPSSHVSAGDKKNDPHLTRHGLVRHWKYSRHGTIERSTPVNPRKTSKVLSETEEQCVSITLCSSNISHFIGDVSHVDSEVIVGGPAKYDTLGTLQRSFCGAGVRQQARIFTQELDTHARFRLSTASALHRHACIPAVRSMRHATPCANTTPQQRAGLPFRSLYLKAQT